ncbi:MAG: MTH1187 family thiamine-binding protein [Calditrichaceae bacterium]|nr:MTH1187 family thiamine-binding protein [Calditrichaceae bacterium]MBN2707951.1 MTH1187 family thiamine-binding protein [Calditrichaceae bacterium]RQV95947.1 MAG: MTH1187 family thiamine-binding protein [Calditrichota bacterium]
MVIADFSIFPVDKGVSLSPYVARVLTIVDKSGLNYTLHAMGTNLEGEYDQVMKVIGECFHELASDCSRISLSIKIDYRQGMTSRIKSKIDTVNRIAGKRLK